MDDEPSDRASVPGNVLLETDVRDECEVAACADLLDLNAAGDVDVVLVVVGEPLADHLDALKRHAGGPPANVGIVSVRDADLVVRGEKRREETPSGPTIRRISDPRDLTGVGMAVSEFLSAWRGDGNRTVVCLDSLTALLEYADARRVYQFCNDLTGKLEAGNARAHFHLAPDAHDERTVRLLTSLFDRRVTAADVVGASDTAEEGSDEAAAADDSEERSEEPREQADPDDAIDSPSPPAAVAGGGSGPPSGPGGPDGSYRSDDENAGWPTRYALYQRTTATVVGVVALLVLLSVLAAAMPIPLGDAPVGSAADGPATTTETPVAAAGADDEVADATAVSTPTPTDTSTETPVPTDTPTATSNESPVSTRTPTATPDGRGDDSLVESIGDTTDDLTDAMGNTTDGVTDLVSGEASDGDGAGDDAFL